MSVGEAEPATPVGAEASTPLFEARDLKVHFPLRRSGGGVVRPSTASTCEWRRGEVLGIVGESGCGKSTLGRTLLGPAAAHRRRDPVDGQPLGSADLRALRRRVQMVFQDPYQSLNPRQTVGSLVLEPLAIHEHRPGPREASQRAVEAMEAPGCARRSASGTATRTSCPAASASAS